MNGPYIGCRVSLISKRDIRYEGILYSIDTKGFTLALQNVISYGTEGRKKDGEQIAPANEIYDYILFGTADIQEITVCQSPDPAIVNSSGLGPYPYPTSMYGVSGGYVPTQGGLTQLSGSHLVPPYPQQYRNSFYGQSAASTQSTNVNNSDILKLKNLPLENILNQNFESSFPQVSEMEKSVDPLVSEQSNPDPETQSKLISKKQQENRSPFEIREQNISSHQTSTLSEFSKQPQHPQANLKNDQDSSEKSYTKEKNQTSSLARTTIHVDNKKNLSNTAPNSVKKAAQSSRSSNTNTGYRFNNNYHKIYSPNNNQRRPNNVYSSRIPPRRIAPRFDSRSGGTNRRQPEWTKDDFDFAKNFEKFNYDKFVESIEQRNKGKNSEMESQIIEVAYNKDTSFYDNLSNESQEKQNRQKEAKRDFRYWNQQRRKEQEKDAVTFGLTTPNRSHYHPRSYYNYNNNHQKDYPRFDERRRYPNYRNYDHPFNSNFRRQTNNNPSYRNPEVNRGPQKVFRPVNRK